MVNKTWITQLFPYIANPDGVYALVCLKLL